MTTAERLGLRTRPFLDRVVEQGPLNPPRQGVDLRGHVELALRSGFPEAVFDRSERAQQCWIESYVEQLLTRHAVDLESGRDSVWLRRYFEALALNQAGVVDEKKL